MKISTKGRYALRMMIDLAEHQKEAYIPMKDVEKRQHISLKYIEKITDKIKDDENHYNVIGELSELANGNNVERITFERYVLAAYFDQNGYAHS